MKNSKLMILLVSFLTFSCAQSVKTPPKEKYNRVMVLGQNPLEILLDLGLKDKIAGIAYLDNENVFKHYPGLPVLSLGWPNKESVLSLQPDAIVALESAFKHQRIGNEGFWRERGAEICVVDNYNSDKNFNNYYKDLETVGALFGIKHTSDSIVDNLKKVAEKYTQIKNIRMQKVLHLSYTGMSGQFYYYPPSMCLLDEIVDNCGGEYINLGINYFIMPLETIMKVNPDKIILTRFRKRKDEDVIAQIIKNPHLKYVKAVKQQEIIEVDYTRAIRGTTEMEAIYLSISNFLKR
ncbi:ABC transporter substrate-binding protein [Rapidithrix thailandica]|uniref:ABC transporter substrate-binding protein n=1 Tax=Rapidithrix thailandica TaxID=413964 RepID=A0AAW9S1I3_9BACT